VFSILTKLLKCQARKLGGEEWWSKKDKSGLGTVAQGVSLD